MTRHARSWMAAVGVVSAIVAAEMRYDFTLTAAVPGRAGATTRPIPVRRVAPLADLDAMVDRLDPRKADDPKALAQLARAEEEFKKSQATGWKPPWLGLIKASEEELRAMKTAELGPYLFKTGVPARESLLYNNPQTGMVRLEVFYPGFREFFGREDCWRGFAAILEEHARQADDRDAKTYVGGMVGLTALPYFYAYPPVRKKLAGHEKELIGAHVEVLRKLSAQLAQRNDVPAGAGTQPAFFATAPASLVCAGLALGKYSSPQQFEKARAVLAGYSWMQDGPTQEIRPFVDRAIEELGEMAKPEAQ